MQIALRPGLEGHAALTVTEAMAAPAMGSGTIEVFASPMLCALMEAAAVDCVERHLPAGMASVGTRLSFTHRAATPVGDRVTAKAILISVEERTLTFEIEARDPHEIIGEGTHTRVIVDCERFKSKLARKLAPSR